MSYDIGAGFGVVKPKKPLTPYQQLKQDQLDSGLSGATYTPGAYTKSVTPNPTPIIGGNTPNQGDNKTIAPIQPITPVDPMAEFKVQQKELKDALIKQKATPYCPPGLTKMDEAKMDEVVLD